MLARKYRIFEDLWRNSHARQICVFIWFTMRQHIVKTAIYLLNIGNEKVPVNTQTNFFFIVLLGQCSF